MIKLSNIAARIFGAYVTASVLCAAPAIAQSNSKVAQVRYNHDGSLDATLDGDGKLVLDIPGSSSEVAHAALLMTNGKVVVAGSADTADGTVFMVARFLSNGALDTTFDGDGVALTNFASTSFEAATAVGINQDGKIVVGGTADGQFALARYETDGRLDTTFDGDGKVLTAFASMTSCGLESLGTHFDGTITVAGRATSAGGSQFALARYTDDGSLDTTFDGDGKVLTDFASTASEAALDLASDGRGGTVAAGYAYSPSGGYQFAIARYTRAGALDTTYDRDGKVLIDIPESVSEIATTVLIDYTQRVLVGGTADGQFALARTLGSGAIDTTFDGDGIVLTDFASQQFERIEDLVMRATTFTAVGWAWTAAGGAQFAGARYNASGTLDTTFDGDGKVLTNFAATAWDVADALAVDLITGKVTAVGSVSD